MPKPSEAHRKLEKLVGNWVGEETIHPSPFDPKGGPAVGRVQNRLALDGFAVVQDYEEERNGAVSHRGHGVFRYDATDGTYELHWLDSMGTPLNLYRGNFEGDVLTLTGKAPHGLSRAVFDLREPGRYSFRADGSPDGKQWLPFMEGRYARRT